MRLLLFSLVLAVLIGYAIGGNFKNLETMKLRWWALALAGLVLQIPPPSSLSDNSHVLIVLLWLSFGCLIAFALINLRRPGFALILAGLSCNFVVIAVNSGMPVSPSAVRASGQASLLTELAHGQAAKHHLQGPGDILLQLADEIPIGWPINQVVSVGDALVYSGMVWVVGGAMRKRSTGQGTAPPQGVDRDPRSRPQRSGQRRSKPSGTGLQS
jgi:hypothetical protein